MASALPCTPAMGAWMMGCSMPRSSLQGHGRSPLWRKLVHATAALLNRVPVGATTLDPATAQKVQATRSRWLIDGLMECPGSAAAKATGFRDGDVFDQRPAVVVACGTANMNNARPADTVTCCRPSTR